MDFDARRAAHRAGAGLPQAVREIAAGAVGPAGPAGPAGVTGEQRYAVATDQLMVTGVNVLSMSGAYAVVAGKTYAYRIRLFLNSIVTNSFSCGSFSTPDGASCSRHSRVWTRIGPGGQVTYVSQGLEDGSFSTFPATLNLSAGTWLANAEGLIDCTVSGSLQPQVNSGVNNSFVLRGSYVVLTEVL